MVYAAFHSLLPAHRRQVPRKVFEIISPQGGGEEVVMEDRGETRHGSTILRFIRVVALLPVAVSRDEASQ